MAPPRGSEPKAISGPGQGGLAWAAGSLNSCGICFANQPWPQSIPGTLAILLVPRLSFIIQIEINSYLTYKLALLLIAGVVSYVITTIKNYMCDAFTCCG